MRLFSATMVLMLVGCGSNWTCPKDQLNADGSCRFPNRYETTPHWADCDGDGWGANDPQCVDLQAENESEPPICGGGGAWVQNGLDCDDTQADSGALNGMACPGDYQDSTSLAYSVNFLGAREYLFWTGQPEHSLQAQEICENWWTNPLRIVNEDFNLAEGESPGGLMSISAAERPGIRALAETFMTENGLDSLDAWVDVRLQEAGAADPVWVWGNSNEADPAVRPDEWCDGPPRPVDIFPLYTESAEQMQPALQMFASTRLVMHFVAGQADEACLAAPNHPIVCPEGDCTAFDFVCERKAYRPFCGQSGDVLDPNCLNVLSLADLTCDVTEG